MDSVDTLTENLDELPINQACQAGCHEIYENESAHTTQRLEDNEEPILGNPHEFCAAFFHTHEWWVRNGLREHQCLDEELCIISKRAKESQPPRWTVQPKTVAAFVKFENGGGHIVYEAKYTNCFCEKKHAEDFFQKDVEEGQLNNKIEDNPNGNITMYLTLQPCNESTSGTRGTRPDHSCCNTLKNISETLTENERDISLRIKVTNTNHLSTSKENGDDHEKLRQNAVEGIKNLMDEDIMDEDIIKFSAMDEEDWDYLFSMTTEQPPTERQPGNSRGKLDQEIRDILDTIHKTPIDRLLNPDNRQITNRSVNVSK